MPFIKPASRRTVVRILVVSIGAKLVITGVALFFIATIQQTASLPL